MADSDEEYDRHQRHDKFTRERREYQGGSSRGRREDWVDDDRSGGWNSGGHRGRDNYGRDHYGGYNRRDRHSPGRGDPSPPAKRMRGRDWDGDRGFGDGHGNNWGQGDHRQQSRDASTDNCPTQPPMMTFKQFLQRLDDEVAETDAVKRYNDYKLDFKKKQLQDFFDKHRDEEWFRIKYHPDECDNRKEKQLGAVQNRLQVFNELLEAKWLENVSIDVEHADKIIRLLDAAVIKLEGGSELDLQSLDEKPDEQVKQKEPEISLFAVEVNAQTAKDGSGDKEKSDFKEVSGLSEESGIKEELETKKESEVKEESEAKDENVEKPLIEMDVKEEVRTKTEEEEEPNDQVGLETSDLKIEKGQPMNSDATNGESKQDENGEEEKMQVEPRPRALHKTSSIFLRNLPPNVVKSEVEDECKKFNGFMRLAIADPQPERRFYRRGWVTFQKNVNIRDICWQLSGVKFKNTETGAIINRDLSRRIRSVNGIASHKNVVRSDVRHAARVVFNLDMQKKLWVEKSDEEKSEISSAAAFALHSKNPLLHNITDYMIEEASAEEEELLGADADEIEDGDDSGPSLEKDEALTKVLDRLLIYLRIVHSIDYYNHTDYPQEDEMPNRIGIMHARGSPPSSKVTMREVNEYIKNFEAKIQPYLEPIVPLTEDEISKLGKLDPEKEVQKYIDENTKEAGPGKFSCLLSGKKFKAPEFVKKHIMNRYPTQVENVRKQTAFFNNFIRDPKRPMLPEHPSNRPPQPSQQNQPSQRGSGRTSPNMGVGSRGPWPPYGSVPLAPYGFGPGMPPRGPMPYGPGPGWNGPPQPFPMGNPGYGAPNASYSNRGRPSRYDPTMLPKYEDVDQDLDGAL